MKKDGYSNVFIYSHDRPRRRCVGFAPVITIKIQTTTTTTVGKYYRNFIRIRAAQSNNNSSESENESCFRKFPKTTCVRTPFNTNRPFELYATIVDELISLSDLSRSRLIDDGYTIDKQRRNEYDTNSGGFGTR